MTTERVYKSLFPTYSNANFTVCIPGSIVTGQMGKLALHV